MTTTHVCPRLSMLRPGFTFVEVALVLIILALIAAVGIPAMRGTLAQQQLKQSANQIRGEWLDARVRAMDEGQILCLRAEIGGSRLVVSRVLDAHFTAGLSSRQTSGRFDAYNQLDPFEKGGFTGDAYDFILRDPESALGEDNVIVIELPKTVMVADVIVVVEERAAFYLGLTAPGETEGRMDGSEEFFEIQEIMTGEIRYGETMGTNGMWSSPIFFYPDGSSTTATMLLKNEAGRCIEVRLRGLTGTSMVTEITMASDYVGELLPDRY
ncbi:MAG: prepilin-type N-terminal cleavage/methylation domain-containing protein [Planctomycetaceae bacterium]|nr:prepilin-type N-terminal cleavage/methylation domain-containing protein [Planctomycetaceae bacterium]